MLVYLSLKLFAFVAVAMITTASATATAALCPIDYKPLKNGTCALLDNKDVFRSMYHLAFPPALDRDGEDGCKKITKVQGLSVCEDRLVLTEGSPEQCTIWSLVSTNWCDHYGSLEFEIYWSERGCKVKLFHYFDQRKVRCSIVV